MIHRIRCAYRESVKRSSIAFTYDEASLTDHLATILSVLVLAVTAPVWWPLSKVPWHLLKAPFRKFGDVDCD